MLNRPAGPRQAGTSCASLFPALHQRSSVEALRWCERRERPRWRLGSNRLNRSVERGFPRALASAVLSHATGGIMLIHRVAARALDEVLHAIFLPNIGGP